MSGPSRRVSRLSRAATRLMPRRACWLLLGLLTSTVPKALAHRGDEHLSATQEIGPEETQAAPATIYRPTKKLHADKAPATPPHRKEEASQATTGGFERRVRAADQAEATMACDQEAEDRNHREMGIDPEDMAHDVLHHTNASEAAAEKVAMDVETADLMYKSEDLARGLGKRIHDGEAIEAEKARLMAVEEEHHEVEQTQESEGTLLASVDASLREDATKLKCLEAEHLSKAEADFLAQELQRQHQEDAQTREAMLPVARLAQAAHSDWGEAYAAFLTDNSQDDPPRT